MKKTTNWSFKDLVHVGACDLLSRNETNDFQQALKKATAVALYVIRDEFIEQLPKDFVFDNDKFCIAIMQENDTVIISYDSIVFEANQRMNASNQTESIGFVVVSPSDERHRKYVDKLKLIKDKANSLKRNFLQRQDLFPKPQGKDYLN
jgi:hypothetical protein